MIVIKANFIILLTSALLVSLIKSIRLKFNKIQSTEDLTRVEDLRGIKNEIRPISDSGLVQDKRKVLEFESAPYDAQMHWKGFQKDLSTQRQHLVELSKEKNGKMYPVETYKPFEIIISEIDNLLKLKNFANNSLLKSEGKEKMIIADLKSALIVLKKILDCSLPPVGKILPWMHVGISFKIFDCLIKHQLINSEAALDWLRDGNTFRILKDYLNWGLGFSTRLTSYWSPTQESLEQTIVDKNLVDIFSVLKKQDWERIVHKVICASHAQLNDGSFFHLIPIAEGFASPSFLIDLEKGSDRLKDTFRRLEDLLNSPEAYRRIDEKSLIVESMFINHSLSFIRSYLGEKNIGDQFDSLRNGELSKKLEIFDVLCQLIVLSSSYEKLRVKKPAVFEITRANENRRSLSPKDYASTQEMYLSKPFEIRTKHTKESFKTMKSITFKSNEEDMKNETLRKSISTEIVSKLDQFSNILKETPTNLRSSICEFLKNPRQEKLMGLIEENISNLKGKRKSLLRWKETLMANPILKIVNKFFPKIT